MIDTDKYIQNLENRVDSLEYQLEQYQSLVKTVDPDNLPDISVFCIFNDRCFFSKLYNIYNNENEYEFTYTNRFNVKITHYIEQRDLIKLFKGGS